MLLNWDDECGNKENQNELPLIFATAEATVSSSLKPLGVTFSSNNLPTCFGQNLVDRRDSGENWLFTLSVVKIAWSLYIYILHMDIQSLSRVYKTWGNDVWQGCDCMKASVCFSTFTSTFCPLLYNFIKGMAQQFGKYSYFLSCTQSEVKVKLQPAAGCLTTNLETAGQNLCRKWCMKTTVHWF